jgi:hypothetical protein
MHRVAIAAVAASASLVLLGCDDHGHPHDDPKPAADTAASTQPAGGGGHGHDHGPGADHAHDAPATAHDLGAVTVAGYSLRIQQETAITPGKEADFAIAVSGGTGEPKAMRLWVGVESGAGSTKVRTHKHGDQMEAHVEVPSPLPEGAKLWVEVETDQGRATGSVDLKR